MATMIEGVTFLRRNQLDQDGKSYHGVGVYRVQSVASSGEASTVAAVRLAMFSALRGDSVLTTALRAPSPAVVTPRVFHGMAPTGTPFNYINLGASAEAEGDTGSYDAIGTDSEIIFDIWGTVTTDIAVSPPPVGAYGVDVLYGLCANVLHGKRLVLS